MAVAAGREDRAAVVAIEGKAGGMGPVGDGEHAAALRAAERRLAGADEADVAQVEGCSTRLGKTADGSPIALRLRKSEGARSSLERHGLRKAGCEVDRAAVNRRDAATAYRAVDDEDRADGFEYSAVGHRACDRRPARAPGDDQAGVDDGVGARVDDQRRRL